MHGNRSRLAASLATLLIAVLSSWGFWDLHPGLDREVRVWLGHTIDLLLMIGYNLLERRVDRWTTRLVAGDSTPESRPHATGTGHVSDRE